MKQIDSYRHRENDNQLPDDQPGNYFVSAIDGERRALVSGPYVNDHAAALSAVNECQQLLETVDARSVFYSFGTCRLPSQSDAIGFLQRHELHTIK